jgi:hypothetical protein
MPKKTKKEKVLAMYHKKLRLLENRGVNTSPVQIKTSVSIPSPSFDKVKPVISEPVNQYFFSDLKKSLLLIIIILGVEVSLYFAKLIK